jgi:hypothetical protein
VKVELRYADAADIPAIVADARAADVAELAALGVTPQQTMEVGMRVSDWTATGLIDDVPVCMFGVAAGNVLAGIGVPWMVSTNAAARHEKTFLRRCRPVVDAMQDSYPTLANVASDENVVVKRWLRWLGFDFADSTSLIGGVAFRAFFKGAAT